MRCYLQGLQGDGMVWRPPAIFRPLSCFIELVWSAFASCVSFHDLLRSFLNAFGSKKFLQALNAPKIWGSILNRGQKVGNQQLKDNGIVWNQSTNQLLIHNLVKSHSRVIHGQGIAKMQVYTWWNLAFWELGEQMFHYLWVLQLGATSAFVDGAYLRKSRTMT